MVLVLLLRYLCGGFRVTSYWAVTRY